MDLGSLLTDQASTRANAVSYDGSVVVGWQDFNGPEIGRLEKKSRRWLFP